MSYVSTLDPKAIIRMLLFPNVITRYEKIYLIKDNKINLKNMNELHQKLFSIGAFKFRVQASILLKNETLTFSKLLVQVRCYCLNNILNFNIIFFHVVHIFTKKEIHRIVAKDPAKNQIQIYSYF